MSRTDLQPAYAVSERPLGVGIHDQMDHDPHYCRRQGCFGRPTEDGLCADCAEPRFRDAFGR